MGFMQVMNPSYLALRKKSLRYRELFLRFLPQVFGANLYRLLSGRRRSGFARLRGNIRALGMVLRGRLSPRAVETLED